MFRFIYFIVKILILKGSPYTLVVGLVPTVEDLEYHQQQHKLEQIFLEQNYGEVIFIQIRQYVCNKHVRFRSIMLVYRYNVHKFTTDYRDGQARQDEISPKKMKNK